MNVLTKKIIISLLLYIFANVKLECNSEKKYFIKSQNINTSNLKNIIEIPNYLTFNMNIISETGSFFKTNINNLLYSLIYTKQYFKTRDLLIESYRKKIISKDELKASLIKNINSISSQHLILKLRNLLKTEYDIYSEKYVNCQCEKINKYFQDIGFLDSVVNLNVNFDRNYASVYYNVNEGEIYRINTINIFSKNEEIREILSDKLNKCRIKPKIAFNKYEIEKFKRKCIKTIQNRGYYNFNSDDIQFYIYKNSLEHNVNIFIHANYNEGTHKKYKFGEIAIKYTGTANKKKLKEEIIYSLSEQVKKKMVYQMLEIKPGVIYSKKKLDNTYMKLLNTGSFKTIDINNKINNDALDTTITLTLKNKYSIEHFMEINFNDSNLHITNNLSFLIRNLLKYMETLKTSVEYSKIIPFEIKKISFLNQYKFKFSIGVNYPFSIIFDNICNKSEIVFSINNDAIYTDKNKSKISFVGNLIHSFNFKKNINLESNITFVNIEKNKKKYIQIKSINLTNKINVKNIYLHNISFNPSFVFSHTKYIFFYKALFNQFYRKGFNILLKIEYMPSFIIKIVNDFRIDLKIKTGLILSLKNDIPDNFLFKLGGNEFLRAWDYGNVGPGFKKTGKGSIMFAITSEFSYKINSSLYSSLFIDCGNVWQKKTGNILMKSDFIWHWILFKQLYVNGGISFTFVTKIITLKFDFALILYNPSKDRQDLYRIRLNIIK